ncbi:uncharacterized protein B0J16DRAFT_331421 [Fusarium flagelliforme]|uniref:uncharacterized protein n=1 Tax=Fusarium flagelliforme TaxID=2675880 RepID=UPI001E8C9D76|nr:uncharacterized protein B0J16DRAFT_331421 [Fusarium flagelliforme]KAH7198960.1 hypothetical protein B0J16DRAFT_331421 [Fusarium flagelliforme]
MTQELCGENCAAKGSPLFGTNRGTCYCGDELDDATTDREDDDQCDIPCPGDDEQRCGGDTSPARLGRLARRQNVAANILLIIYIDINADGATITAPGATVTLPGDVVTLSGDVVTLSGDVITQSGSVITQDAVTVTAPGATVTDVETVTTTFISTVTDASETFVTTVTATLICNSGRCDIPPVLPVPTIVFVFKPYPGDDCADELVYLPSPCSCAGGVEYVPHYCDATSCTGKTVYKPEKTEYSDDVICYYPSECTHDQCDTTGQLFKPYDKTQTGHEGEGYPKPHENSKGHESEGYPKPHENTNGGKQSEGGNKGYENGGKSSGSGSEGSGSKGVSGGEAPKGQEGSTGDNTGSESGYPAPEGGKQESGSDAKGSNNGGQAPSGDQAPPTGQAPAGGNQGSEQKPSTGNEHESSAPGDDKPVVVSLASTQTITSIALIMFAPVLAAIMI